MLLVYSDKYQFFKSYFKNFSSYGIHFSVQSVSKEMSIFAVAAIKEVIILTMIICFIPIYKRVSTLYLHNYFDLHVCPFIQRRWCRRPTFEFQIPAVVSQSVTNKSCLVCVKSRKYASLETRRSLGSMRNGKADPRIPYSRH